MRDSVPHRRIGALLAASAVLAGCAESPQTPETTTPRPATTTETAAAAPAAGFGPVAVEVRDDLTQAPFDEPREAVVPDGWTMSVWARTSRPRLMAWASDGTLLVSVPSTGQVLRYMPRGADAPEESVLLDDLDEPHGLAFAGTTLYVAESDQVNAYDYADGAASNARVVAGGLPDDRSPDLRGAYSHVLKSVAVGPDGAVYFSIGSTGNISAGDRTATPPRATIMRVPPGGGPAEPFATGVRNGTGLAVAPDGAAWVANNGRDNVAFPEPGPSYGKVLPDYVGDNPPEQVAKLTAGRELGWPYCNNVGGPADLPFVRDVQTNPDGAQLDCDALPPVEQSMGAHSAPLGLSFTDGRLPEPFARGALVGVHGSWNR